MGRLVRDARLETREARRRLLARKEPHWRLIIEGVHLGYYKGSNGGMWYARARRDKKYYWEALATSDDTIDANGKTVLNYAQAHEQTKKFAEKIFRNNENDKNKAYTVKDAVEEYVADFKAYGKKSLYATETQINAHILPYFSNNPISTLTFKQLSSWKNDLATTNKRVRSSKKINYAQNYILNQNNDPEYQRKRARQKYLWARIGTGSLPSL